MIKGKRTNFQFYASIQSPSTMFSEVMRLYPALPKASQIILRGTQDGEPLAKVNSMVSVWLLFWGPFLIKVLC
jgi:hypothetical protein